VLFSLRFTSGTAQAVDEPNLDKEVDEFIGDQKAQVRPKNTPLASAFNPRITVFGDVAWLVGLDDGDVHPAPPFIRMEVHDRLSLLAGDAAPAYDPLAGSDAAGVWMKWARAPGTGWQDRKSSITIS
jgi:hypothetical protein